MNIPNELWLQIFDDIHEYRDLTALQQVCKRFYGLLYRSSPTSHTPLDKLLYRDYPDPETEPDQWDDSDEYRYRPQVKNLLPYLHGTFYEKHPAASTENFQTVISATTADYQSAFNNIHRMLYSFAKKGKDNLLWRENLVSPAFTSVKLSAWRCWGKDYRIYSNDGTWEWMQLSNAKKKGSTWPVDYNHIDFRTKEVGITVFDGMILFIVLFHRICLVHDPKYIYEGEVARELSQDHPWRKMVVDEAEIEVAVNFMVRRIQKARGNKAEELLEGIWPRVKASTDETGFEDKLYYTH